VPADGNRARSFAAQADARLSQLPLLTNDSVKNGIAYDAAHDVGEALLAWYGYGTTNGPGQHAAISTAEIRIKVSIGTLAEPVGLFDSLADHGLNELPLTIADAQALESLHLLHRDPFDRLLVAQALARELTLMTTDDNLRRYPIQTL
jgi:hypothetical protein